VGEKNVAEFAAAMPDVFVCAYAPHSLVFPRAALIVHQGGIGTLAQALRSGRPQLIVPFFADQLDNASRAEKLGVARSLPPERYTAQTACTELRVLLRGERYAQRAASTAKTVAAEDGAARAAAEILFRLRRIGHRPAA
jgi:UDP:flavonoid glycosyltransferase YjiC (YdhE family)